MEEENTNSSNAKRRSKRPWTPEEDVLLRRLAKEIQGQKKWIVISAAIAGRSRHSCRARWCYQLDAEVKRRPFTLEEDKAIMEAQKRHGNKWATIARVLNGRTGTSVRNHWNSAVWRNRREREELCQGRMEVEGESMRACSEPSTVLTLSLPGESAGSEGGVGVMAEVPGLNRKSA